MQDESTLIHREFSSDRSFDAVVAAFEAAVGPGDGKTFQSVVDKATECGKFCCERSCRRRLERLHSVSEGRP